MGSRAALDLAMAKVCDTSASLSTEPRSHLDVTLSGTVPCGYEPASAT
jgi:hypothetical protein